MTELAAIILRSGRAGVELALFVLLPVMVVMLTLMRLLEAKGILDRIVRWVSPLLLPLGIPGLGVFALLQVLLVSFAAPLATLTMMDKSRTSRRHIAAVLALVFGSAQANLTFPMSAVGLDGLLTLVVSAVAAILGATAAYHLFGRGLEDRDEGPEPRPKHRSAENAKGVLNVINHISVASRQLACEGNGPESRPEKAGMAWVSDRAFPRFLARLFSESGRYYVVQREAVTEG